MTAEPPPPCRLRFGTYELDARTGEVWREGAPVRVPPQPFKILFLLASRAGEVVSREEMRRAVWGDDTFVDFDGGLNFCVNQLRRLLHDRPESPRFIQTLPRRGYRFIVPVERMDPARAAPPGPGPAGDGGATVRGGWLELAWAPMGLMRGALLAASQSRWLRERAMRRAFVRRAVAPFMPGEELEDALGAAAALRAAGMGAVLTRLGENVVEEKEADAVASHYLGLLERVRGERGAVEISVKPTQLGLDLDEEGCCRRLLALAERAEATGNYLWIDMEQTAYTDATLRLCRRARERHRAVGVCLQSYLRRTAADLEALLPTGAGVRLVKGAYQEPPERAFPRKADVDASYRALAARLIDAQAGGATRAVFGTHDPRLIAFVEERAAAGGGGGACEFHLLYGIQRGEQERLVRAGRRVRVLVSYGAYWFPWYMRRLAERPANVLFVARSLLKR